MRWHARDYRPGDLAGRLVAYASTHDPATDRGAARRGERGARAAERHRRAGGLRVLRPGRRDRGGDLQIAIGTGGREPRRWRRALRRELERTFGPEYGPLVAILGAVRHALPRDPARAGGAGSRCSTRRSSSCCAAATVRRVDRCSPRIAGRRLHARRLGVEAWDERDMELVLLRGAAGLYLAATVAALAGIAVRRDFPRRLVLWLVGAGLALHVASIVIRAVLVGHLAVGETSARRCRSWRCCSSALFLLVQRRGPLIALGAVVMPLAFGSRSPPACSRAARSRCPRCCRACGCRCTCARVPRLRGLRARLLREPRSTCCRSGS